MTKETGTPRAGVSFVGDIAVRSRIHEGLPAEKFRLRAYLGEKSPLRTSPLFTDIIPIGKGASATDDDIVHAVESGVLAPDDWVVFGTDRALLRLTQSAVKEDLLLGILPARTPEGLRLLGSKSGLTEVCERYGIPHPTTRIATNHAELTRLFDGIAETVIVKGDAGGGGTKVVIVPPRDHRNLSVVTENWFPVVVQDYLEFPLIAVEALFRHGRFAQWVYSDPQAFTSERSQSTIRRFIPPSSTDFVDSLERLGHACGLHGFANVSFLWDEEHSQHLLFEADMRPNLWHQFGPRLGRPWWPHLLPESEYAAWRSLPSEAIPQASATIHLYPRELDYALRQRRLGPLLPWVRREEGTWETRQRGDRVINRVERRSVIRAGVQALGLGRFLRHNPPAVLTPETARSGQTAPPSRAG